MSEIARNRRRKRLWRRTKPDYCYSDEENAGLEYPEYNGPWHQDSYNDQDVDDVRRQRRLKGEQLLEQLVKRKELELEVVN